MNSILSTFKIKPDQIDQFIEAMIENQTHVRAEPGNIEMHMFQDPSNPANFYVFGRNEGGAAQEAHTAEVAKRGIEAKVEGTLAEPPVTRVLGQTKPEPGPLRKTADDGDDEQVLFFIFTVAQGQRDRVISQFEKHVTETLKEDGCLLFDFYTVENAPETFVVYERWRNAAALWEVHMTSPYAQETGGLLEEVVSGDLKDLITLVREVGA